MSLYYGNMDISHNQRQLFGVIDRSYMTSGYSGRPAERGVMTMNYTDKINARSYANYPHQIYNQLGVSTHTHSTLIERNTHYQMYSQRK